MDFSILEMDKKTEVSEFEIVELSKKGNGIGFLALADGSRKAIEVSFALPQDVVKAELVKKEKNLLGRLQEIIKPSPLRQAPKCKHFGDCGGCRFQNMPYDEQLKIKEQTVHALFQHLLNGISINPIEGCDQIWQYRNKMEFTFSEDQKGNRYLGLIKDLSKGRVVNLQECHLVSPWFMKALNRVKEWWESSGIKAFSSTKAEGILRSLTLREGIRSEDRMAILTVASHTVSTKDLETFVDAVNKTLDFDNSSLKSIFLRVHQAEKGVETNYFEMPLYGADHIRETLTIDFGDGQRPQDFTFHISPTAFFQPNTYQAEKIYSSAMRLADIQNTDNIYDLYCGSGAIGVIAARKAKRVVGVEISPESIRDAKINAELNGINNMTFYNGAVRNMFQLIRNDKVLPEPDIVFLNPPRPGLDPAALQNLIELAPPKILYISSNPKSQEENVRKLMEHGYKLVSMQPIDQFPHTPHVENIVLLKKVQ